MGTMRVAAHGTVDAPADVVYGYIADMHQHPHFLPPQFANFAIESGGVGAGTVVRFTMTAGRRTREYRMTVAEPQPGRVLTESDQNSSLVTTFTVTPDGEHSRVEIETTWQGAGGVGGFFERTFAPRVMERLYGDELARLNYYARSQSSAG
jgi:hypothetical protein